MRSTTILTCEDIHVRLHAFTAEYLCRIFIAFYSIPRQNPCSHTISASLIHTPDMTSQQVFGVYIHVVLLPLMEQQRTIQFSCTVQQGIFHFSSIILSVHHHQSHLRCFFPNITQGRTSHTWVLVYTRSQRFGNYVVQILRLV